MEEARRRIMLDKPKIRWVFTGSNDATMDGGGIYG